MFNVCNKSFYYIQEWFNLHIHQLPTSCSPSPLLMTVSTDLPMLDVSNEWNDCSFKLSIMLLWFIFAVAWFKTAFHLYCRIVSSICWCRVLFMRVGLVSTLCYWEKCCYANSHKIHMYIFYLLCGHAFSLLGHKITCLKFHLSICCIQHFKELPVFQIMSFILEI